MTADPLARIGGRKFVMTLVCVLAVFVLAVSERADGGAVGVICTLGLAFNGANVANTLGWLKTGGAR